MLLKLVLLWTFVFSLAQHVYGLTSSLSLSKRTEPLCTNFFITVDISALNAQVDELLLDLLGVSAFIDSLAGSLLDLSLPVHGDYSISARYCEPAPQYRVASRANTLQILVHGATYNKDYWSGDGAPGHSYGGGDQYSWASYAGTQGYPTLAFDRLGNGNSSHPDGVLVVQNQAHAEVLHQVILKAVAGHLSPSIRAFQRIILVGHSYGSAIANILNQKYPSDVSATILTGFSSTFKTPAEITSLVLKFHLTPANALPRFADLPPTYFEFGSFSGVLDLFWHGGYDPAFASFDYSNRGTISVGELLSIPFAPVVAPSYNRPVYLVTGASDFIFCNPSGVVGSADCSATGPGYLAKTRTLYPAAKPFDWYAPPNSGHCWQYHYEAAKTFAIVHTWLAGQGF